MLTRAGDNSLTVTWTTDDLSTSRVVYDTVSHPDPVDLSTGPNYGYAYSTTEDPTKVTSHSVTVTGVTVNQTYYYRVVSHGSPEAVGSENPFATYYIFGLSGDGLGCANNNCGGVQGGQTLGALTGPATLGLAFAPTAGQEEVLGAQEEQDGQVLGTESANPTPSISPTVKQNPVSSSTNWVLGHKKISLTILVILAALAFFLYRKKRKNASN